MIGIDLKNDIWGKNIVPARKKELKTVLIKGTIMQIWKSPYMF